MLHGLTTTNSLLETNSLFEEDYWLDSVAPGSWDKVEVKRDGRVIGRLPYVLKRRLGVLAVSAPLYTPWLGPWIRSAGAKGANELAHQHEVLEKLASGIPKAARIFIPCAPEVVNLMALFWAGYSLHLHYTYRITELCDEERLWNGLRHNVRKNCRKAEQSTVVTTERSLADVLPILEKTFRRQGQDRSSDFCVLERIDGTMSDRNQRKIYAAEDPRGRIHGFAYVVFDQRHSFYLAGGGDPELRNSGAQTLAVWHAIKDACHHSEVFDFEGSMIPSIEMFIRGFGGSLIPRYSASWDASGMVMKHAGRFVGKWMRR